ncbi:hypothetical protein ONZ45_g3905 [Pleurotus djamor]|nr:hypothetical protein ONZ45_g14063 [Pleurotus djamor]KAJ8519098.1 hypothetical protein ONZ45_g3905 [Pleurotus djamor]
MATQITVRIYQTNTNAWFKVVETSVHHAGIWEYKNGEYVLTIGYDTSGAIKVDAGGEEAVFVFGAHDGRDRPWCDVVTDLKPGETASAINREYYPDTAPKGCTNRSYAREKHQTRSSVTNKKKRRFDVEYKVGSGVIVQADIVIH